MIEIERAEGGRVLLRLNTPGAPVNVLGREVNLEFKRVVEETLRDPATTGLVIGSAKADFVAGGDLEQLRRVKTPREAMDLVAPVLALHRFLETSTKPVVAALNGSALGGGLELALSCHHRIAADNPDSRFALPEVTLGLMPGAGGTQRLPRMIGLEKAAPLLLEGRMLTVREAAALGLIEEVVPADRLIDAALAWLASAGTPQRPWDRRGFVLPGLHPQSPEGRFFFVKSWPALRKREGGHDPAAAAILQVLHHGLERDIDAGLAIETRHFGHVVASPEAKNKIRTQFYLRKDARSMKAYPQVATTKAPAAVGVIGGGQMGSGIAYTAARAGMRVALIEVSADRAAAAHKEIGKLAERDRSRGRMDEAEAKAVVERVTAGADYALLGDAEAVIEAVFEDRDMKRKVIAAAAAAARPGAVMASNTSTLPITDLAAGAAHADRLIGTHFFWPVQSLELVEIIRHKGTSDETLMRTLALAKKLRKAPIVVNDGPGFYTSRVVTAYTGEMLTLIGEGVPPQTIDNVAMAAGMPIGPAALADITSYTLLTHLIGSLDGDGTRPGMQGARASQTIAALLAAGRPGKAGGGGVYDYADGKSTPWRGLSAVFPAERPSISAETIRRRLFHAQSLEAVRSLEEGIIASPGEGDLASVLGWKYPTYLGGVFAYVDTIGAQRFVEECDALAAEFGGRFVPPALLRRMAAAGERFHPV